VLRVWVLGLWGLGFFFWWLFGAWGLWGGNLGCWGLRGCLSGPGGGGGGRGHGSGVGGPCVCRWGRGGGGCRFGRVGVFFCLGIALQRASPWREAWPFSSRWNSLHDFKSKTTVSSGGFEGFFLCPLFAVELPPFPAKTHSAFFISHFLRNFLFWDFHGREYFHLPLKCFSSSFSRLGI